MCDELLFRLSFNPFKMNVAVQMLSYCHRTQMELSVGSGEVLECLYGTNRLLPGVHKEELSPASIATVSSSDVWLWIANEQSCQTDRQIVLFEYLLYR